MVEEAFLVGRLADCDHPHLILYKTNTKDRIIVPPITTMALSYDTLQNKHFVIERVTG